MLLLNPNFPGLNRSESFTRPSECNRLKQNLNSSHRFHFLATIILSEHPFIFITTNWNDIVFIINHFIAVRFLAPKELEKSLKTERFQWHIVQFTKAFNFKTDLRRDCLDGRCIRKPFVFVFNGMVFFYSNCRFLSGSDANQMSNLPRF